MPRFLWFALGVLAGSAYASRLITREGLASASTTSPTTDEVDPRAMKERLAEKIEAGAIRISGFIEDRAHVLADALRSAEVAPRGMTTSPTSHEVLESPFPQTDPATPAAPILQNPQGKAPVGLEHTADQSGLEDVR